MEITKKIKTALKVIDQDLFEFYKVVYANHQPHSYNVGLEHQKYIKNYLDGKINEDNIKRAEKAGISCAFPGCFLKYNEHTFSVVCLFTLLRNGTKQEANAILDLLTCKIGKDTVQEFIFAPTRKGFTIE